MMQNPQTERTDAFKQEKRDYRNKKNKGARGGKDGSKGLKAGIKELLEANKDLVDKLAGANIALKDKAAEARDLADDKAAAEKQAAALAKSEEEEENTRRVCRLTRGNVAHGHVSVWFTYCVVLLLLAFGVGGFLWFWGSALLPIAAAVRWLLREWRRPVINRTLGPVTTVLVFLIGGSLIYIHPIKATLLVIGLWVTALGVFLPSWFRAIPWTLIVSAAKEGRTIPIELWVFRSHKTMDKVDLRDDTAAVVELRHKRDVRGTYQVFHVRWFSTQLISASLAIRDFVCMFVDSYLGVACKRTEVNLALHSVNVFSDSWLTLLYNCAEVEVSLALLRQVYAARNRPTGLDSKGVWVLFERAADTEGLTNVSSYEIFTSDLRKDTARLAMALHLANKEQRAKEGFLLYL